MILSERLPSHLMILSRLDFMKSSFLPNGTRRVSSAWALARVYRVHLRVLENGQVVAQSSNGGEESHPYRLQPGFSGNAVNENE